jgi:hypothetical protein
VLTGSPAAGPTGVAELFLAFSARLVRADAAAFVDPVCRGELRIPPRAGVLVTVAGAVCLRLAVAGARGGLVALWPAPPRGATIVDDEREESM